MRSSVICLLIFCVVTSGSTNYFKNDRDLSFNQLVAMIRPTLSPSVQSMLDGILADETWKLLDHLEDLNPWNRVQVAINILMKNTTYKSIIMKEDIKRMQDQANRRPSLNDFPCKPIPPNKTATSIHELTPGDINVVAAMGDSLTAGNGVDAITVLGVLLQYRGEAWSIGGEDGIKTNPMFPNILRKYNDALLGYSTGICGHDDKCSHFNVAIPGETARGMSQQARDLIQKLKENPAVDFENDWKMVTIFIGQNDICSSSCKDPASFSATAYRDRLQDALDILYGNLPRTFVNLVSMVDAYQCKNLNIGLICTLLHLFECPCGAFNPFYEETKQLNEAYQNEAKILAEDDKYRYKSDFTVVLQPFFMETVIPRKSDGEVDLSYFAPDCFHFSKKGQAEAAKALWNSMLEPVGKKKLRWHPGEPYECPTVEEPYFCTYNNCHSKK